MSLCVDIEKRLGDFHLTARFETGAGPLALLGASGGGKSVTLRCAAGLIRPDRGRITLDGQVLFDSEKGIDLPPRKRRVGYLFQQYALFPHWTARQNLLAAAGRKRADTAEALLARFRLSEAADLRPAQLSGGQQQRLALARMLAASPKAILLDEPLSALDPFLRTQVELELAETLSAFPGPAVWVTHDRGEVLRNCGEVCVLDRGRTQPVCAVESWYRRPSTEAGARLAGWENLADARAEEDGICLPQWGVWLRCGGAVPPDIRRAGFRSASVRPAGPGEENGIPCRVLRVLRELEGVTVLLMPEGAVPDAPPLRMALREPPPEGETLTVTVPPESVLIFPNQDPARSAKKAF